MQSKNSKQRVFWLTSVVALCMLLCTSCSQEPASGTIEEMSLVGTAWHGTLSMYNNPLVKVKVGLSFITPKRIRFSFLEDPMDYLKASDTYSKEEEDDGIYVKDYATTVLYDREDTSIKLYTSPIGIEYSLFKYSWIITNLQKERLRIVIASENTNIAQVLDLTRTW